MCEHLQQLDDELKSRGLKETLRGQAWSDNCREWANYEDIPEIAKIKAMYNFPSFAGYTYQ